MKNKYNKVLTFLYKHKLMFCIFINVFLFAFYALFHKIYFETNDDNTLSRIISGFYGENEAHMIFVNYSLGCMLKVLYLINQNLPWYEIFQYTTCFISLTAINYFLIKTIKNKYNIFLVLAFDLFIAYEIYVKMQFTKVAGVSTIAGVLLILLYTLFEKRSYIGIIIGVLLSVIGFCFRANMFLLCVLMCSSIGVIFLLNKKEYNKKVFTKKLISCGIALVLMFISVGVTYFVDISAYSTPEWKTYFEKYNLLCDIFDYGDLNFDKEKLENNGLDFDDTEIQMLKSWKTNDPEVFSTENLNKLSQSLVPQNKSPFKFASKMFGNLVLKYYVPFLMFLAFLIVLIIRNKVERKYLLSASYVCLLILAVYYILFSRGRVFINRVDCMIWFSATIPIIMMTDGEKIIQLKKYMVLMLTLFISLQVLHYPEYIIFKKDNTIKTEYSEAFSEVRNDKDHLYLSSVSGLKIHEAYTIFDDVPMYNGDNIACLGGWTSYAPFETKNLKKFNISNPFSDIIDNEKVYIIDNNIESTIRYIKKHYNSNAEAVLVNQIGECKIYKIEG